MAVTRRQSCNGSAGTATFGGAVSVGDLIIVFAGWNNTGTGITDQLGNVYTQQGSSVTNNTATMRCYASIVTVAGTPTLTLGSPGGDRIVAGDYMNFAGTPTILTADFQYFNNPTGTTAASNTVTANTSSVNNEYFVAGLYHGNISTGFTTTSPFTNFDASAQFVNIADILAVDPSGISAGNTAQYSTSWTSGAVAACAISAAFYDQPANTPLLGQTTPTSGNTIGLLTSDIYWITSNAFAGGVAKALNVCLGPTNVPAGLLLGLFDQNGNLLASGSVASPAAGLNTATISNVNIVYGQQYSVSVQATTAGSNYNVSGNPTGTGPIHAANTPNTMPSTLPGSPFVDTHGLMTLYVTGQQSAGASGTPLGGPARTSWHWRSSGGTS